MRASTMAMAACDAVEFEVCSEANGLGCADHYFVGVFENRNRCSRLLEGCHSEDRKGHSQRKRASPLPETPQPFSSPPSFPCQFRLDFLDRREAAFEFGRKFLDDLGFPLGNADWFFEIAKGVLDNQFVFRTTQEKPDRRLVVGVAQQIVNSREIHVHGADKTWIERNGLELHHDVTSEFQMIKKEIEVIIVGGKFEVDLSSYEREACAKFEQKTPDVIDEGLFDFPFAAWVRSAEEVEEIGVLENLGGHIRFDGWQRCIEISGRLALTLVSAGVNLDFENASRPAMCNACLGIPVPDIRVLDSL